MREAHFYSIGIAFACGVFLRSFFEWNTGTILLFVLIGVCCLCAWFIRGRERQSPLILIALIFIVCSLGMFRFQNAESQLSTLASFEGEQTSFRARVAREPDERDTTTHLYVYQIVDGGIGNELILVMVNSFEIRLQNIQYGDDITVEGKVKKPKSFVTDTGKEFPYEGFLRARGVLYTIPFAHVSLLEHRGTFLGTLYRGKQKFLHTLERAIPEPASGLGAGMLLGVNSALGKQLDAVFRETGIIHIVVLSGYNIMVVVEALLYILAFFCFPRTRMIIGIAGITIFALLVGLSATVMRASLMATLLLIARTTGRTYAVLRALVLAGVFMLVLNPYLLVHDPGFQLSFLATLGLILFSPHIEKRLTYVPEKYGIRMFVTATIATQIAVLPLILYHMGLFSVVALIVNVLVLPMVPPAMGLTFLTGVLGLVSVPLGTLFGFFAYLSLMYIVRIAEFFGNLPFASFSVNAFPFWIVLVSYVLVGVGYVYFTREKQNEEENPYAGWIIEEEVEGKEKLKTKKEKSPEAQSASGDSKSSFPFR